MKTVWLFDNYYQNERNILPSNMLRTRFVDIVSSGPYVAYPALFTRAKRLKPLLDNVSSTVAVAANTCWKSFVISWFDLELK